MSSRFSLRDFQQGVLDRLKSQTSDANRVTTLGVVVGKEHWLVDMADISEALPVPTLTHVPSAQPWFCGVANVRGNLYSVTDLAAFFGHEVTERDSSARVLLLGQKYAFSAGLLVTRVLGLRNAKEWKQSGEGENVYLQDSSGQKWRRLDIVELLNRPEFLHIGVQ
ncbi:MAG: chemotaxis protein CheW [Gallionellaceae bacterium]